MATKQRVNAEKAPVAIGPYSQGVKIGDFVYTAGQIPIDPTTGTVIQGGIAEQARRVLDNLSAVLEAAGTSLDNVVKTTVYLSDMGNFAAMNEVYKQYFNTDTPPARSTVQVAGLPMGSMVEIECVAALT